MFAASIGPVERAFCDSSLPETIVGTRDPAAAARAVDAWVAEQLGRTMEAVFHCAVSVGALFGVRLDDGRLVALKAQPPNVTRRMLGAVHDAQRALVAHGFPAPLRA